MEKRVLRRDLKEARGDGWGLLQALKRRVREKGWVHLGGRSPWGTESDEAEGPRSQVGMYQDTREERKAMLWRGLKERSTSFD